MPSISHRRRAARSRALRSTASTSCGRWRRPTSRRATATTARPIRWCRFPIASATAGWCSAARSFSSTRNWPGVNHPMHGDGWAHAWQVVRSDAQSAEIVYEHERAGDEGGWPFRYRARQSYRLDVRSADRSTMSLENLEDRPVPAGIGLHPFFVRDADSELHCRTEAVWRTDAEVLPIERIVVPPAWDFSRSRNVNEVTLDNCFDGWDGRATIGWPQPEAAARSRGVADLPPSRDLRAARPAVLLRRAGEPRQRPGRPHAARCREHARRRDRLSFRTGNCEETPCLSFAFYPSLKGRSVFVSGGGSGIGASIVEHFAAQGAKVGFVDINEPASTEVAEEDRRAVPEMRHPRREGLPGRDRRGRGQARRHHRAGQQRRARRSPRSRT